VILTQFVLFQFFPGAGGDVTPPVTLPPTTTGGLPPKRIRVIDRKGRVRDDEDEPKPETVRQTINRLLGIDQPKPAVVEAQAADAIDVSRPAPLIPLTEAQRQQVIAALSAVPDETLLAFGLEESVERAALLIKELEQDDEEAVLIILAVTLQ